MTNTFTVHNFDKHIHRASPRVPSYASQVMLRLQTTALQSTQQQLTALLHPLSSSGQYAGTHGGSGQFAGTHGASPALSLESKETQW